MDSTDDLSRSRDRGALHRGASVDRYVVLEHVGEGAMGEVVRAYDPKLRREVAIKRLHSGMLDPHAEARLLREAQAMAQLNHPHVVAVYDVERTPHGVILAMEYVDGESLRAWMQTPRRWPDVVARFAQAGRALHAAHLVGLVHRDFKPGNVMCGRDGRVRVMDFGLARSVAVSDRSGDRDRAAPGRELPATEALDVPDSLSDPITREGAVVGTPAYMAPEQHVGAVPDPGCDQYAFCVSLWEALWGERPFRGTIAALALQKHDGPPSMPKGKAPRWLYDVVARGLSVEPQRRFPSMAALLAALERDRTQRRMGWGLGGGALLVAFTAIAVHRSDPSATPCPDPRERLVGIWDDARRDAIDAAIRESAVAYAADTADRVRASIDAYATAWAAMKQDACEATHVRGEQSASLLDLRMSCLHRRRDELRALVDVLATPDAKVIERATTLVSALSPIVACGDLAALAAAVAPPDEPEVAQAVEQLRGELATAWTVAQAIRYDEALLTATALVERADAIDYTPIRAEAHLMLGRIHGLRAEHAAADHHLLVAFQDAVASGDDVSAVSAAVTLTKSIGIDQARLDAGDAWARTALAIATRIDPNGRWVGEARQHRGTLALMGARYADAVRDYEAAVEILTRERGPNAPAVGSALDHLGTALDEQQRLGEAEQAFRRALEIAETAFGPEHPATTNALDNLALNLQWQKRFTAAKELQERAIEIRTRVLGADHPGTALSLNNAAWTFLELGELQVARDHFERARTIFIARLGAEHPRIAMVGEGLAHVAQREGDLATAEAEHARALAIRRAAAGSDHPNVALSLMGLGMVKRESGRLTESLRDLDDALAILDARGDDARRYLVDVLLEHARTLAALHRPADAHASSTRALALIDDAPHNADKIATLRSLLGPAPPNDAAR